MKAAPAENPTDEELLALIAEIEGIGPPAEAYQPTTIGWDGEEEAAEPEVSGEPCPHCQAPSLDLDTCGICGQAGCLPRDDWMPGMDDPCITMCTRCAVTYHINCGGKDHAGNFVCVDCKPVQAWDEGEPDEEIVY